MLGLGLVEMPELPHYLVRSWVIRVAGRSGVRMVVSFKGTRQHRWGKKREILLTPSEKKHKIYRSDNKACSEANRRNLVGCTLRCFLESSSRKAIWIPCFATHLRDQRCQTRTPARQDAIRQGRGPRGPKAERLQQSR